MIHPLTKRDVVGYWSGLFNDEEIDEVIKLGESLESTKGLVGVPGNLQEPVEEIRNSTVSFIHRDQSTEWIFQRYDGAVNRLNTAYFHVDVEPLTSLQFTTYKAPSGHYEWHWDMQLSPDPNSVEIVQPRKISVVTQLSDPNDYEGGDLSLAPCGRIFDVKKEKGATSVFLSFVNHKVSAVTKGTRYSLVGWCEGPDWR